MSEDKLQRHLLSSGACRLLFSLDRTGMMYRVCSTACGTIFLALQRDLLSFLDKCTGLNLSKYFRSQP